MGILSSIALLVYYFTERSAGQVKLHGNDYSIVVNNAQKITIHSKTMKNQFLLKDTPEGWEVFNIENNSYIDFNKNKSGFSVMDYKTKLFFNITKEKNNIEIKNEFSDDTHNFSF